MDVLFSAEKQGNKGKTNGAENQNKTEPTWVEELFQGTFTNETRCLNCETVSLSPICKLLFADIFTCTFIHVRNHSMAGIIVSYHLILQHKVLFYVVGEQ